MSASLAGEPREKRESQGGGFVASLSGGDERSEPESQISSSTFASVLQEDVGGAGAGAPGEAGCSAPALPCQYSDNCIGEVSKAKPALLSPHRKKSRHRLILAIEMMVNKYGINHVGLLTLSFGVPGSGRGSQATKELRELAKDLDFVQKRWASFRSNVIADRYADWICILEPHKDWVWHIHVVVTTKQDIRTGTDMETLSNYRLPYWMRRGKHLRNEALAAEWQALRETACKYRFGRVELLPIKKTKEAFARYLGKYLTKAFNMFEPGRKNRLVRFSRGIGRQLNLRFSIFSLGNLIYRTRLRIAAACLNFKDYGYFADLFGSRWNYYLRDIIGSIPVPMIFAKGEFESGVAARKLAQYAENPLPFLDDVTKKLLNKAYGELWRKFENIALDESAQARYEVAMNPPADNLYLGPVTEADLYVDLFQPENQPF